MVRDYSEKKVDYMARMGDLLSTYRRLIFCNVDNVQSQQMHNIRRGLRNKGVVLMGKNTLMRKTIRMRAESPDATEVDTQLLEKVVDAGRLVKNLGIIFTNEEFDVIQEVITKNRIQAPARVGAIAPLDVSVPAGNTGLEPGATSFFQALQINTKIVKGAVEIVTEKKVLTAGDKVDNSTAVLLQKLKIKPFFYGLAIEFVFDNGEVFGADILELKDDFFQECIEGAIKNITCLSLATGVPTEPALPHVVTEAFKNLLALSLGTEYTFDEFNGKEIVEAIKSGKCIGAAPAAAAGGAAPAAAAAAPAPEPEEEDEDMGLGLFD